MEFSLLRRTITMTCAAGALASMSACAPADGDKAPPTEGPAPTSSVDAPALSIDQPKNVKAVSNACDLLTPEQVASLGNTGKPKEETALSGEKKCTWSDSSFQMTITSIASLKRNAERMYQDAATNGHSEKFKVEGYPAANIIKESEISTVELAVSEDQTFSVQFGNIGGDTGDKPEMADSQGYAKKIASEVLKNIPDA